MTSSGCFSTSRSLRASRLRSELLYDGGRSVMSDLGSALGSAFGWIAASAMTASLRPLTLSRMPILAAGGEWWTESLGVQHRSWAAALRLINDLPAYP